MSSAPSCCVSVREQSTRQAPCQPFARRLQLPFQNTITRWTSLFCHASSQLEALELTCYDHEHSVAEAAPLAGDPLQLTALQAPAPGADRRSTCYGFSQVCWFNWKAQCRRAFAGPRLAKPSHDRR
jgi:hypothetical protein